MYDHERMKELRAEDPHGLRSDNELTNQIELENLHERIANMPDFPEDALELRQILSDIVGRLEALS